MVIRRCPRRTKRPLTGAKRRAAYPQSNPAESTIFRHKLEFATHRWSYFSVQNGSFCRFVHTSLGATPNHQDHPRAE